MIERGQDLGFTLESGESISIECELGWEDLQRDVAIQFGIAGAIDLAHAAGAEGGLNLVRPELRASGQTHFFSAAVQFKTMVIGAGRSASTVTFIRKRPSLATAYSARDCQPDNAIPAPLARCVAKSATGVPAVTARLCGTTPIGTAISRLSAAT